MLKLNSFLFIFFACLASCSPQEDQKSTSENVIKNEDANSFVSIGWVDPHNSNIERQVFVLLSKHDIDVYFEGSIVYGVFVKEDKADNAIALIKESELQVFFPQKEIEK